MEELRRACVASLEPLCHFDVQRSACHCPNDFYALLALIEAAFGSHHCFNRKVRHIGACLLAAYDKPPGARVARDDVV